MARLNKQGLDYFPLDVHLNDKIELIEAEHGLIGFSVFIKLLQKIYFNGYFCKFCKDEQILFSKRVNVDINKIDVIINSLFARELLSEKLYSKYGILTSCGIQERFIEATLRRKQVNITKEYCLLDTKPDNDNINWINVDNKNQSKVKKSKVDKKKLEENMFCAYFDKIMKYFLTKNTTRITRPEKSTAKKLKPDFKSKLFDKGYTVNQVLLSCDAILQEIEAGDWDRNNRFKLSLGFLLQKNYFEKHSDKKPDKEKAKPKDDPGPDIFDRGERKG